MTIDKDAVTFEMLPDGKRKIRIKKEKWGGAIKEQWKTEHSYLDGDYIVLIQKKTKVYI